MNARPSPISMQTSEARIAEAKLTGCLRTIYENGGMSAVITATTRAVRDVARENRERLGAWVV